MKLKILAVLIASLWALPAHAAVITTQEWTSLPGAPWSYSAGLSGQGAVIDAAPAGGSSPSGGGAIRMQYNAGTYSQSTPGGRAEYALSGQTDLYVGNWVKFSSGFVFHPVASKMVYLFTLNSSPCDTRDNFLLMTHFQNNNSVIFTQQLGCAPGTQNRFPNLNTVNIVAGQWFWLEYHARQNTVGKADGLIEVWINDVPVTSFNNVTHRTWNTTWGNMQLSPEWGGGGAATLTATQYVWFDHTVISTTKIGMPGGNQQQQDNTAPTPATLNSVTGGTAGWTNGSDANGIASTIVYRCSPAPCAATGSVFTLSGAATSWADPGRTVGVAYSYRLRQTDPTGNLSAFSNVLSDSAAASTSRSAPTITDDFNRANNADLGAAWDAGYTNVNKNAATLISNEIRGTAVNASDPKSAESNNTALPNDQWCKVVLGTFTGSEDRENGCLLRATAPPTINWYWFYARKTATNAPARNSAIVSHHTAGAGDSNLASDFTTVWGSGDTLIGEAEGTTLRLKRIPAGSSVESTILTVTDSEYSSGRAGVLLWMNTGGTLANSTITDFQAGGFTSASGAAISLDNISSSATGNTTNTISWSHTVGTGSNKELLIYTSARDTSVDADTVLSGCTVGGTPATIVRQDLNNSIAGVGIRTAVARFENPNGGANTITCTWAGLLSAYGVGSAISWFGVDQASPIDASAGGTGTGTAVSTSITTATDGAMISSVATGRGNTLTVGGSAIERVKRSTTGTVDAIGVSSLSKATAGVQAMTYTHDAAQEWSQTIVALKPATVIAIVEPKCATFAMDSTGLNVTFGSTIPTKLRIDRGSNSGLLLYQSELVVGTDIVGGRYSRPTSAWEPGLDFAGCHAINAAGVENKVDPNYLYVANDTNPPWSGPVDTAAVVMSGAFPSGTLPAGTIARDYGFLVDKGALCNASVTDQDFDLMELPMTVISGTASANKAGLTDNSTTTLYGRCSFTDLFGVVHKNTSSIVITLTVAAAPGDTTLPADVTNLVCTEQATCVWDPITGDATLLGYQISLSTDACSTFFFVGSTVTASFIFPQIAPGTAYCASVRGEDTAHNLSLNRSNQYPFTTPPIADVIPPSDMKNLRECGIFSESVQLCFEQGTDDRAAVVTLMEYCVGVGCTDFQPTKTQTNTTILATDLTPGTLNRFRGKFTDGTNVSKNYSNIAEATTFTLGPSQPHLTLPAGIDRGVVDKATSTSKLTK